MKRFALLNFLLLVTLFSMASTIVVNNINELNDANKKAQPGDVIILIDGEWKNVTITLNCSGTKEKPIIFKAQTAGKVFITGASQLKLGGNYLTVDGLYFTNGYAGDDAVINFRIDKDQLANNCRVTNCVVNDFNNPKRMDENNWVAFYGKNNRLDHCSFKDKKNIGVLLAIILDDDRSRENFHLIDNNYFGRRPPLASNGGEIIRVGVSQHAEFNSNTQITDNYFDNCDGETEIVSIKSGSNVIKNNLFKECQGSVVLRHGDNNTVENNIFLGNDKTGTGGVRVINKGQWVVNNFFYKCRGTEFRSPLAIMNGIPNSPAHRYVQVTDAVIANNSFYNCSPISFGEGSDTERSLPPANVILANNLFYNNRDSVIYNVYDDIQGFSFMNNEVSKVIKQGVVKGFIKTSFGTQKNDFFTFPVSLHAKGYQLPESLQQKSKQRLQHTLSQKAGFPDISLIKKIQVKAYQSTGAKWFSKLNKPIAAKMVIVNCATAAEVYEQLERNEPSVIKLTGKEYTLDRPFVITNTIRFTSDKKKNILINTSNMQSVFIIGGNGNLSLHNMNINGNAVKATHFISNDSSGSSAHYNLNITNCSINDFSKENGCQNLVYAYKYMVADSFVISNNTFLNNNCNTIMMVEENDDKGYYNAEKIVIRHNSFTDENGTLLNIYRGGNDESTLGPALVFSHNKIINCNTPDFIPLITLTGVQQSAIFSNEFTGSNKTGILLRYHDTVRAAHLLERNIMNNSGRIEENSFVKQTANSIK